LAEGVEYMPKLSKGCGESGLKFPAPKMARTYIGPYLYWPALPLP